MSATLNYSPGLEGVIAGVTTISKIDSEHSSLIYRGYDVHDLAENGCFEETAYLLLENKLPNKSELEAFKKELSAEYNIPKEVYDAYKGLPSSANLMDQIRTGLSILSAFDPEVGDNSIEATLRKAKRILAKTGIMVANGYRIREGKEIIQPDKNLGIAANFLYILDGGKKPDSYREHIFDTSLTLYAEHGYNASTFACRVTVATLSDIYSGMVTGVGTLKGPLHGGANEEAMKMLIKIGTPDKAQAWIDNALANKEKVMGFGHREYKKRDSRAIYLTKIAKEIGLKMGETKWGEIADILEATMERQKGLHPNVDFPAAYAYYLLGIPIELYTPIFVTSRVSGWSAHVIEQLSNNRLIRPKCIYEGQERRAYTPINER